MPSSAARRMILEEAPSPAAAGVAADEDWSIPAIAARAAAAPEEVQVIAGLFHNSRLTRAHVAAEHDNIQMEARSLFPDPPAEISDPAKSGYDALLLPRQDWPQWRREIYDRWARQCGLIEKALGVDVSEEAVNRADYLMGDLASRALAIPAKSIKDVLDKIGVLDWQMQAEVLDEDDAVQLLRIIETDLKRLDERAAA